MDLDLAALVQRTGVDAEDVEGALTAIVVAAIESQQAYASTWEFMPYLKRAFILEVLHDTFRLRLTLRDVLRTKGLHTFIAFDVLFALWWEPDALRTLLLTGTGHVFPLSRMMVSLRGNSVVDVDLLRCYSEPPTGVTAADARVLNELLKVVKETAEAHKTHAARAPRLEIKTPAALVPPFCDYEHREYTDLIIDIKKSQCDDDAHALAPSHAIAPVYMEQPEQQLIRLVSRVSAVNNGRDFCRVLKRIVNAAAEQFEVSVSDARFIALRHMLMLDALETLYREHYTSKPRIIPGVTFADFFDSDDDTTRSLVTAYDVVLALLWAPKTVADMLRTGAFPTFFPLTTMLEEGTGIDMVALRFMCPWRCVHPETLMLLVQLADAVDFRDGEKENKLYDDIWTRAQAQAPLPPESLAELPLPCMGVHPPLEHNVVVFVTVDYCIRPRGGSAHL